MAKRMSFEECTNKEQLIQLREGDKEKAEELLSLVEHREKFWNSVSDQAKEFPSLFIEGYYEIIKELITTILSIDGWKALNHECLFSYLRKKEDLEIDFDFLLELKDTRNSIDYRGVMVRYESWKNNKMKINLTVNALKEYISKQLEK